MTHPQNDGHRDRLRARFSNAGPDALADYELLELFLFRSIPRRDVKPLAKALIARFGDFAGVLAADADRLCEVDGITPRVALDIKLLHAASLRAARHTLAQNPVIGSWSVLLDYVQTALGRATREQFRVLFLDKKNRLIADELQAEGTVDHAPAYPREVMRRALELGASAVILVHNHPGGDPTPSVADVDLTKLMVTAGRALNITVHDHLVVGRGEVASFKALGLI